MSLPKPPVNWSAPVPPTRKSLFSPPLSLSLPSLPSSRSSPTLPLIVSFPAPPSRRSLPLPPFSVSPRSPASSVTSPAYAAPDAPAAAPGQRVHAPAAPDLDGGGQRCEGDVDVAVGVQGQAVHAHGDRVVPRSAHDDDDVSGVAQRHGRLDLPDVRLGGEAGPEERRGLVDREALHASRPRPRSRSSPCSRSWPRRRRLAPRRTRSRPRRSPGSVASSVGSIVAVTARVPGLYEQVSAAAVAGYETASTAEHCRQGRQAGAGWTSAGGQRPSPDSPWKVSAVTTVNKGHRSQVRSRV